VNETELAKAIGPVSMRDYEQAPDVVQHRIRQFVATLSQLDDAAFVRLATAVASEVIISESNRSTLPEPYIKNTAIIHEAQRRHEAAGHDPKCGGDNLYDEATSQTRRNFGFKPDSPSPCTCGQGD
jgi:hypothetical protein